MVKVQSRGLGKGLSALISENYVQAAVSDAPPAPPPASGAPNELPHGALTPGKYQPRTRFDDEHLHELATSIEKNGIMQPIVVRAAGEKYEIIAGERRWRAAKMAGLENVPVIIREVTDIQALELALIENIQRQDLSPLEEASGYQRLLEDFNYTQEELAETVGKSRSHISNLLRLLSLPEDIKPMLEDGRLSMGHARALLTAAEPLTLARTIVDRGLNVRQAEELARSAQGQAKQSRPRASGAPRPSAPIPAQGTKDPDIMALEENISESLGMRVAIQDRGGSGEISITYEGLSQLDELLRRLNG